MIALNESLLYASEFSCLQVICHLYTWLPCGCDYNDYVNMTALVI